MAETETQTDLKPAASEAQSTSSDSNQPAPTRPRRAGVIFAVLLSLIAIGGAGYFGYRLELQVVPQLESDRNQSLLITEELTALEVASENRAEQMQKEVQALRAALDQQSNEVDSLGMQIERSSSDFAEKINAAIESASSAQDNVDQQPKEWQIEDIALLLLIGGKQLQLTRDPTSVLPIWDVADQQISRIVDPQMLVVRIRIGEEIELMKAMQVVDIENVSGRLIELVERTESLPLRTELTNPPVDQSQATDDSADQQESSEGNYVAALWTDLKSLVRVQKIGDESTLPLNPSLANELTQQIKLSLLAAQIAALQGQTGVYQTNLEYVESVLDRYFNTHDDSVVEYSDTLDRLFQTPVESQIPDVSGSYKLLQEILDRAPIE